MKLRRWRSLGPLLILVLGAVPSACGPAGVAEFQLYNQAFNSQFEQGDAILDSVARAERTVVLRGIRRVPLFQISSRSTLLISSTPWTRSSPARSARR
jgi:hypothetical protein